MIPVEIFKQKRAQEDGLVTRSHCPESDRRCDAKSRATETVERAPDEGAQSLPTLAREPHRAKRARGMPRQALLRERARPGVRGRHSRTARWRRGGRTRAGGGRGRAGEIGRGSAVTSESWMQRQARARVSADPGTHACTLWAPAHFDTP